MDKEVFMLFIVCLFFTFGIVGIVEQCQEIENSFDVCEEQPLFNQKYSNCDNMECIVFHEEIKSKFREHCK